MKNKGSKKPFNSTASIAAILGILGVSINSNAQASEELVNANSIKGVANIKQLSDGSLELVMENGDIIKIAAEDVLLDGGNILIQADALTALAEAGQLTGSASFLSQNALLIAGGAAVVGGLAAAGGGGSGGGDDAPVVVADDAVVDAISDVPTAGDDALVGTAGDDIIDGLAGNDSITGLAGNDTLSGGAGDDLIAGGGGTDILDGGDGVDTNSFEGIGTGVTASLETGEASYGAVNETFTNFENLTGSDNNDDLSGDADTNVLTGGLGDDTLSGGLGNDIIAGGEGIDTADFSDIDVPVTVTLDADGNGTATRDTGFTVTVSDAEIANSLSDAEFVSEALDGNIYFNIHTAEFTGGEIRGQVAAVSDVTEDGVRTIVLEGDLDAAQEPNNASDSEATGFATVTIVVDADGNATYSSSLTVDGIAPSELISLGNVSAIHLHNAPAGANGPVLQDFIVDAGGTAALPFTPVIAVSETDTLTSIENVIGSDNDDSIIFTGAAANTVNGGAGDDLIAGGGGTDILDGGEGNDTNSFQGIGAGVTATIAADGSGTAVYGQVSETFTNFENLTGSDNNDTLIATGAAANTISGGAGDDLIAGGGGTDILDGGEGNDTNSFQGIGAGVTASLETGEASYGAVNETFTNFENLTGSDNNDTLSGDDNVNVLTGGSGDDTLSGGLGNDIIAGGEGIDTADFSDIDVPVTVSLDADGNGTATRDTGFTVTVSDAEIANSLSDAEFVSEALDGNIYFNIHTAEFTGGEIRGQLAAVSDVTEDGIRTIVLEGDLDAAQEPDNASDSEATGFATVTIVVDADGNATYSSSLTVDGIAPSELISLGPVSAIHLHNAPAGVNGPVLQDFIVDAGGTAALPFTPVIAVSETDTLTSIENVIGSDDGDSIIFTGAAANTVNGGAGDDLIAGGGGTDILDGGEGNDTNSFQGIGAGVTATIAADGSGTAVYGQVSETFTNFENLTGSDNNDVLIATGAAANIISGGAGDDLIAGGGGTDILDGGEGNDTNSFQGIGAGVTASLETGEASYGAVNETFTNFENLTGSDNDDNLSGDTNDNVLTGGLGDDTLTGGAGSDIFVFNDGDSADTVTDFSVTEDTIELNDVVADASAALALATDDGNGNTVIDLGEGGSILLTGVSATELSEANFDVQNTLPEASLTSQSIFTQLSEDEPVETSLVSQGSESLADSSIPEAALDLAVAAAVNATTDSIDIA